MSGLEDWLPPVAVLNAEGVEIGRRQFDDGPVCTMPKPCGFCWFCRNRERSKAVEIRLTKGKTAVVSEEDSDLASIKWHAVERPRTFYARHADRHGRTTEHVMLHQVIAKRIGIQGMADHIDRNGLNCLRSNLRPATKSQNAANEGMRRTNTTGYRGVSRHRSRAGVLSWQVKIRIGGKKKHIGYFDDQIEAARAYDTAAKEAFGEYASLNFPG